MNILALFDLIEPLQLLTQRKMEMFTANLQHLIIKKW